MSEVIKGAASSPGTLGKSLLFRDQTSSQDSGVPSLGCLWHQTCCPFVMRRRPHNLSPLWQLPLSNARVRGKSDYKNLNLSQDLSCPCTGCEFSPGPWSVSHTSGFSHTHSPAIALQPQLEPLGWLPPTSPFTHSSIVHPNLLLTLLPPPTQSYNLAFL